MVASLRISMLASLASALAIRVGAEVPPNNSFKVTRRPVTQFAVANWAPVHRAPQLNR